MAGLEACDHPTRGTEQWRQFQGHDGHGEYRRESVSACNIPTGAVLLALLIYIVLIFYTASCPKSERAGIRMRRRNAVIPRKPVELELDWLLDGIRRNGGGHGADEGEAPAQAPTDSRRDFARSLEQQSKTEDFVLSMVTANVTAWSSGLTILAVTTANTSSTGTLASRIPGIGICGDHPQECR